MDFTPQQVAEALAARQVSTQCPRCTTPEAFDVVDGLIYLDLIGGQNLRNAALTCRRCGFLSLHSLAALGLDT
jgi:5-methylcytosine-specific restriction endonuclease McrA